MDFKYLKDENDARIYPVTHSNGVVSGKHSDKTLTQELDNYVLVDGSKNLLNPTMSTKTQTGITCTNNGDGTYALNGTASATATFDILSFNSTEWNNLVAKGVKLVGCPSGGSLDTYVLYTNGSFGNANFCTNTNGVTISNTQSTSDVKVRIQVSSGQACNNLIFKPMITTDMSATYNDYQPYFKSNKVLTEQVSSVASGMAEIAGIVTTDHLTLTNTASSLSLNGYGTESGGRNLVDYIAFSHNGVSNDVGTVETLSTRLFSDYIPCSSIEYTVHCEATSSSNEAIYPNRIIEYGASKNFLRRKTVSGTTNVSFTPSSDAKYVVIDLRTSALTSTITTDNLKDKIIVCEGTYSSYEPYFASNKSLTDRIDRDYELERFGYVCPIINGVRNFVDSNGVLHRKIARVDLTDFDWHAFTWWGSDHTFQASLSSAKNTSEEAYLQGYNSENTLDFSNAILSGTVQGVGIRVVDDYTRVIISDSSCTTAEQMKAKLKAKYLYYELATEETYSAYDTPSVQSMISDEWQSGVTYSVGSYCICENVLYKCLVQNSGQNPKTSATYWQKCKVTDVDRVALQTSTQTSFAELARSVPEGYKYSMQLNITNFTDKPSGITSWFAYCDISASNMSGFVSLILTSNQGMWYGKYGSGTVTWTKVVD